MNRKQLALAALLLAILSTCLILTLGRTCILTVDPAQLMGSIDEVPAPEDLRVELTAGNSAFFGNSGMNTGEEDTPAVELVKTGVEDGRLILTLKGCAVGKTWVRVEDQNDPDNYILLQLYTHASGVITRDYYPGRCRGGWSLPAAICIWLLLLLVSLIRKQREALKTEPYSYRGIRRLGVIIFLIALLPLEYSLLLTDNGILETFQSVLWAGQAVSLVALPIAFLVSLMVTLESLRLLIREGFGWRNLLALGLSLAVCFGTLLPELLNRLLLSGRFPNLQQEGSLAGGLVEGLQNSISICVVYLECSLLAAVLLSARASRRQPPFDRDYVLILGCGLRADGSLTPLLKGRVDRALEFARAQEQAGGSFPVLVPSGGQGSDEVRAEAAAMTEYLLACGVPRERILTEDRSLNTDGNFRCSMELILGQQTAGDERPKLGFSTTDYHVFRAGNLAAGQGINAVGMGSRTRSYFRVNAFVREFIASLVYERRVHAKVLALLIGTVLVAVLLRWLCYLP